MSNPSGRFLLFSTGKIQSFCFWAIIGGLILSSKVALAQGVQDKTQIREIVPFLDSTFVGFAVADGQQTFEADIVPNFAIPGGNLFTKLGEEFNVMRGQRNGRWAWAASAVPMVKIRMFINEPSSPVRTPSYMPKGTVQFFVFRPAKRSESVELYSFQATVGHHSNGQDGCLYLTREGGDCVLSDAHISPSETINTVNGSFSTNYVTLGARLRVARDLEQTTTVEEGREARVEFTMGGDLELNPGTGKFLGGGGIDPDQKALYGPTRVSGFWGAAWRAIPVCYRIEARGGLKYLFGTLADGVKPWVETVEGTCLFKNTGWGLSARLHHGQDYYNLGYGQQVTRFQVGFTYSQEGFLKFRLRPPAR